MDSINQNQPEDNIKNLHGEEAVKQIREMVEATKSCFFCTNLKSEPPVTARPMAIQKVDEEGNIWFLSDTSSNKNRDIEKDPNVQLLFQHSEHAGFLSIYGKATILFDKQKIHELWEPLVKVWFTEGEDDPRISIIKVEPEEGYYWDNKHGAAVAFVKMLAGAVTGQTLDDSIEGRLHP